MNKNQKPKKETKIYALIVDREVFVGKTSNRDLAAVYRNHTRGRCGITENTVIAATADASMYLLEEITACTSVAYHHVVAWVRVFTDAGYTILNPAGTQFQAADIHPVTQLLVDLIRREPLSAVLERTHITAPGSQKRKADAPETHEAADKPSSTKMTLRLEPEEKEAFATCAMDLGLTQRDTLMHLLQLHDGSDRRADDVVLKTQQRLQRSVSNLQKENQRLHKQIERLKSSPESLAPKMTQRFREAQAGIEAYFHDIVPQPQGDPLPRTGYKRYKKANPQMCKVDYRKFSDVYTYTPTVLLYGHANPPAYFWIGSAEDGTPCKIRIYEKSDFLGVSPLHPKFSVAGVRWFVQTRTAADGAEDLILAFPYIVPPESTSTRPSEAGRKPTLDERIAAASAKNNYNFW